MGGRVGRMRGAAAEARGREGASVDGETEGWWGPIELWWWWPDDGRWGWMDRTRAGGCARQVAKWAGRASCSAWK